MARNCKILVVLAALVLSVGACSARGERSLAGGAVGAASGALLGALGGDAALGAAVGGIVGTGAGYLSCQRYDRRGRCM